MHKPNLCFDLVEPATPGGARLLKLYSGEYEQYLNGRLVRFSEIMKIFYKIIQHIITCIMKLGLRKSYCKRIYSKAGDIVFRLSGLQWLFLILLCVPFAILIMRRIRGGKRGAK